MLSRLLIILFCFFLKVAPNDEVTMSWNEARKLSWSDFKGPVEQQSDAVAVTASGITFSFSVSESDGEFVDFKANVHAHFYPEKSWYNKVKGDDYILAHEQLHFDITELHVRQLRYNISKLKLSRNIKTDLRRLHDQANVNLAKMQNDYDMQTNNSIEEKQQVMWSIFVAKELKKYHAFRSR